MALVGSQPAANTRFTNTKDSDRKFLIINIITIIIIIINIINIDINIDIDIDIDKVENASATIRKLGLTLPVLPIQVSHLPY